MGPSHPGQTKQTNNNNIKLLYMSCMSREIVPRKEEREKQVTKDKTEARHRPKHTRNLWGHFVPRSHAPAAVQALQPQQLHPPFHENVHSVRSRGLA
jgi:hypothetical protein